MNSQTVFLYVFKAVLVSGIFLGYYWLALRNKKFHHYNRFYLLFSLVLSVCLPLVNFTWIRLDKEVIDGTGGFMNYMINPATTPVNPTHSWMDWVLASGILVAVGCLYFLVIHIHKIYRLKQNSIVTRMGDIDFVETDEEDAPFSFLNNLFWKRSISLEQEDGKKICKHELTHIRQRHTLDRLFCQLLCSVIWINPFYWIIQKELLAIHEFIADEQAIEDADAESFARMLLQAHYGNHFFQQTQSFFYSSIKRRLFMLTTSKNIRYSYVRRLFALPLLALTMAVFSLQVNAKAGNKMLPDVSVANKEISQQAVPQKQESPKFPGGSVGWQQFLRATCNHDRIVEKGGPPGKYTVKLSFIVDKEGNVKEVEASNDPGYGSKEDAVRVLSASPKWTPAMVNGKKVVYRDKISITYMVSDK